MTDDLISRQAAIKAIENLQDCYNGFSDTYDKACIIGVLEEIPTAQVNTPTDTPTDTISRQAAIDALSMMQGIVAENGVRKGISMAWQQIEDLPSAQPEIIRCKDCKHRNAENGFCEGRGLPMQLVPDDGFCDKGERRTDE